MSDKDTEDKHKKIDLDHQNKDNAWQVQEVFKYGFAKEVGNEQDLEEEMQYHRLMRQEQINRAQVVSVLLKNYSSQQVTRTEFKEKLKPKILRILELLIGVLTIAIIVCMILAFMSRSEINGATIGMLVTACVTYIGSLITVLIIIVKYIFPENEEASFNDLVKSIITNDTERMKSENETKNKH